MTLGVQWNKQGLAKTIDRADYRSDIGIRNVWSRAYREGDGVTTILLFLKATPLNLSGLSALNREKNTHG